MPSCARLFFVAVHAVIIVASTTMNAASAKSLGHRDTMPLPFMASERALAGRIHLSGHSTKTVRVKHGTAHNHSAVSHSLHATRPTSKRGLHNSDALPFHSLKHRRQASVTSILSQIDVLNSYYNNASTYAKNYQTITAKSSNKRASNSQLQQQAAAQLTGFQTNFLGFQNTLKALGADKGLANYDRSNDLETLLKDMVNANKNVLSDTTTLVYNIPGLGPILGPIVYEIKCILEELLDFVENLTDGLLNDLEPLLEPIIGQANQVSCNGGIEIAGVCL